MLDKVEFRLQHCEAQEALLPPTAAVKNRHRGRRRSSVDLGDLEGKLDGISVAPGMQREWSSRAPDTARELLKGLESRREGFRPGL